MKTKLAMCFVLIAFIMVGCAATTDNNITGKVVNLSPERARFAGMIFAQMSPIQARSMSGSCEFIIPLSGRDDILAYLEGKLTDKYFSDMTPEQAKITKDFILSLAGDVGLDIDFDLGKIDVLEKFDIGNFKAVCIGVCEGINAGLK